MAPITPAVVDAGSSTRKQKLLDVQSQIYNFKHSSITSPQLLLSGPGGSVSRTTVGTKVTTPVLWPQHHSGIFRKGVLGAEPLGEPEGVLPGVVRGVAPGVRMSSLRACVSSLLSALSGTRPCTTQHCTIYRRHRF